MAQDSRDFLDWADGLVVEVRFVDYLDRAADEVWRLHVVDSGFHRDVPVRMMQEAGEALGSGERGFALDVRRSYQSWGADASFQQVVLTISSMAVSGIVGNAAWEALSRLRTAANGDVPTAHAMEHMGRDEAVSRADWHVRAAYGLPHAHELVEGHEGERPQKAGHALTVERDSHTPTSHEWEITLADSDWNYEVVLSDESYLAELVRISRSSRHTGPSA